MRRHKCLPYIIITVPPARLKFLIDSGAETSIAHPEVFSPKLRKKSEILLLNSLNGQSAINSAVHVPIFKEFNEPSHLKLKFVDLAFSPTFTGLIGSDILCKLEANIDYKNRVLQTRNAKIPFFLNSEEEQYHTQSIAQCNSPFISFASSEPVFKQPENLNYKDACKLNHVISSCKDLFFKEGDNLTFTSGVKHIIPTKYSSAIYTKTYRYPEIHREEVDEQIREMLNQGIISPSISPYNAPLWVVPKKMDNSNKQKWRLVIDYRKLNEQTIDDKFPIPNIEEIFDKLGKCQYFTTLDLAKGFYKIEVHQEDKWKTAFSNADGHYEFNRMPFGLKNSPSTFQRLMNQTLKDYINKISVVYIDDILVFCTSFEEHLDSMRNFFETLRKANLIQIAISATQNSTKFLGHVIEQGKIKPDPLKIETIKKWPLPKSQKEIKSFLGITGYYRKFIKDYAKVASPMINYLKKNKKVNINDKFYKESFKDLKLVITSEPVLTNPDFSKKFTFTLTTDALQNAIGAVLSQNNHPVSFALRTLNEHEKRYSTI